MHPIIYAPTPITPSYQNLFCLNNRLLIAQPRPRYGDFSIVKIADAVMMDFKNFKCLTVEKVKKVEVEVHQRAKFRRNRWNRGLEIMIFRFFKMALSWPLFCVILPNLVVSGTHCVKLVDKAIPMDNLRLLCLVVNV